MSFDYIGDNYCKFEYTGEEQHNTLFAKEGRKEMFYLTTHSTHFYLRLYGIKHMVKDHSDSERRNPLPPLQNLVS